MQAENDNRIHDAIQAAQSMGNSSQINVRGARGPGLSIKGMAGPYVVVASNFAPGTTAADIETAMHPVGGEMISCRLISANPTVMAEMVFAEKEGAEKVISTFNNQKVWPTAVADLTTVLISSLLGRWSTALCLHEVWRTNS